jgi:hypothetical protein
MIWWSGRNLRYLAWSSHRPLGETLFHELVGNALQSTILRAPR